jgi:hypothetical protein
MTAMRDKRVKANMNAWQEEMTACQDAMETNPREKVDVVERQKIPNEEVTFHSLRACRNERMACQEREAHLEEKELTSVETKPKVTEQREVPVENAILKMVKGRKKQHRGKKQAAG